MTRTRVTVINSGGLLWLVLAMTGPALAHDPIFGIGPHVLFKGGFEFHMGTGQEKADSARGTKAEGQILYGITGDWAAGIGIPYVRVEGPGGTEKGRGATNLSTKYRFWRNDMRGAQESAAVLAKVIFDDTDIDGARPDGNDYLLGLTYGYEGRKWYRWASVRRRFNSDAANGGQRGDIWFVDLAGGIRFIPTEYTQPDWVWMLELNGEITENTSSRVDGSSLRVGGNQWFLSPGLMWTRRNVAIKAGVQIPVYNDLAASQVSDDYRAIIEFELHL